MPRFSKCLIELDISQRFEYASGIKYARVLNMMRSSYNDMIILVINVIMLEDPGGPQLTILSFINAG